MNQHGGDLTPSVTPTITPVVNTKEKSKESTITVVPPTQEYLDMFSQDDSVVQHFIQTHAKLNEEMDVEFIASLNRKIGDVIQSHPSGYDVIKIVNNLPMEKTNMVANYLNIYYEDEEMARLIKKQNRKMREDIKLLNWVFTLYDLHAAIRKNTLEI
jgi:hypothetical protein